MNDDSQESPEPDVPLPATRLLIDLAAVVENWHTVARLASPARAGAVVKADAYGLGAEPVSRALVEAGCLDFFVAGLDEALPLRARHPDIRIYALAGLGGLRGAAAGACASACAEHRIVPVLNAVHEVQDWVRHGHGAPAALQLDTGLTRSGLGEAEVEALRADGAVLPRLNVALVLHHFACADEPGHPLIALQVRRFEALRAKLPPAPTSAANSAATLLGPAFHGDLVRPGLALYGGHPLIDGSPNPFREVVRVQGRVLQVRDVLEPDVTVGYGATYHVRPPARLATVGIGYADGYMRALSGRGIAAVAGRRVPVVGRVSMDLVTLDVTALPAGVPSPGDYADLIGGGVSLEEVARLTGTISYELLTRLSPRAERVYVR
jgi:alanine racemase